VSARLAATASALVLPALMLLSACEREKREPPTPPESARTTGVPAPTIRPGDPASPPPGGSGGGVASKNLQGRAYDLSEGKRLYSQFNCVGCHAHGGGAIGPALMDGQWVYGSDPVQIYASIVEGRPNGMPAFGGKIPDHQVWQLVAYVRSLSGLAPKDAAPVRDDHMQVRPAESLTPAEKPPGGPR
jgi:cytochrome c oxidase cbb3-type subunit III